MTFERMKLPMSKQQILSMLRQQTEGYLSGETMSHILGISRAAVNKAVNALRQDGYEIESATRKGYRLLSAPDLLTEGEILPWLHSEIIGKHLICLDTIDSTNDYLKQNSRQFPSGTVAVADQQTGGRGRLGRSFHSPGGTGIYMSAILKPDISPMKAMNLTAYTAVAVCDGIQRATGLQPRIKWTNDLVLNERKICGILTEMAVEGESGQLQCIVLGIGINVNEKENDFPAEIRNIAGSLAMAVEHPIQRGQLTAEIINSLDRMYADWREGKGNYLDRYRAACVTLGKEVQVMRPGRPVQDAFAEDIDDEFSLIIRLPNGSHETIRAGEVSVRGLWGYV